MARKGPLEYMDRHARMAKDCADGRTVKRPHPARPGGFGGASDMSQARGSLLAPWVSGAAEKIAQSMRNPLNQMLGVRSVTVLSGWGGMGHQ
jgi:hypothetical protein